MTTPEFSLADALAQADADAQPSVPPSGITDLYEFFDQHLSQVFKRDLSGSTGVFWCAQWNEHYEAVIVVEALWTSWEVLRLDVEMGMATWMRDFAYPLMGRLFDPSGTFSGCTAKREKGHRPSETMALNETTG